MKIDSYRNDNEMFLWSGKPNKSVYIKEQIFSPFLIFAALWLAIDAGFIIGYIGLNNVGVELYYIIPFFILHLMPVWIYLFRVIFACAKWKNTEYMVTDKAIYALTGVFTTNCQRKTFQEVTNVSVHQGVIDKRHNVGDIFIVTGVQTNSNGQTKTVGINIVDIENYMEVYKLITRTGADMFSDTMYPNDLRPSSNHGYNTSYKPKDKE